MPNAYDIDPYGGQKSLGKARMNGQRGADTMTSRSNADLYAAGKGGSDPFAAYGNAGSAWAGALGRKPMVMRGSAGLQPSGAGRSVTYADPRGGTTHTQPMDRWQAAPRMPWEAGPVPPGMTRPFGEDAGTISRYDRFLSAADARPINEPGPGNYPLADRFRPAPPIPQGSGPLNPNFQYARDNSGGGFNPDGPALPPPTPNPLPPPAAPGSRPGGRPSNQLPPQPFVPYDGGRSVTYADPSGGTTHTRPPNQFPVFQPNDGRSVTYADPQGGTTHAPQGGQRGFVDGLPPEAFAPGRSPVGIGGPQYTEDGRLLGSNGIGLRYRPNDVPVDQQGASGERAQNYIWKDGKLVPADWSGTATPPAATTTGTGTPSVPGANTSTTTGQFGAPNNTTTFDPNVLPQSNIGSWLDPVQQDAMDRLSRQLRHEGSLTGATNSGGFIPGMAEKLAPVANQFAAQKGQLMFQDQQAKADRLLDKYKFDNTQQLQSWIENNRQELERYGIDQNVLLGRYSADAGVKSAGMGAAASRYGADASKYNAMLDYMQGMAGIGANYGLGQDRLGFDYYNADQNYGLGREQLGYNYWNSGQQRAYDDMFNQRGYDLGVYGINRDVYGMDQAQQRYLMDLMWRMSPGGQMGGGYFPAPSPFPYGG